MDGGKRETGQGSHFVQSENLWTEGVKVIVADRDRFQCSMALCALKEKNNQKLAAKMSSLVKRNHKDN